MTIKQTIQVAYKNKERIEYFEAGRRNTKTYVRLIFTRPSYNCVFNTENVDIAAKGTINCDHPPHIRLRARSRVVHVSGPPRPPRRAQWRKHPRS